MSQQWSSSDRGYVFIPLLGQTQANENELNWNLHLSFPPSSSILIRSFMSWSWLRRSSISTGFPTCRSSVTASREDAQMTLYSEGPDCDLIILFFIASQTHTQTHTHTYVKCCWNSIYSHLLLLLYFWFANILFGFGGLSVWLFFCSNKVALTSHWTTEGIFNRHYFFNTYEAWIFAFLSKIKIRFWPKSCIS